MIFRRHPMVFLRPSQLAYPGGISSTLATLSDLSAVESRCCKTSVRLLLLGADRRFCSPRSSSSESTAVSGLDTRRPVQLAEGVGRAIDDDGDECG